MTYCAWTARSPTTPRSSSSSTRAVSPCPTRASENCARPRKARPLLPSAPHRAHAPFPLTGQQLPCLGQSPFPVHPFGAMMPPPPLYDSGALPPGIMDNTPRKRPRSNPSFGGVGRGSHLTPSPLGGRPGSALGGHHRHRADGRPSSALGGPPGLSIRKINFSTSPSPQPGAENGGGLAPRPTSAPAFRRCISPFGLFKPVATDASNSYLTAINALVNRPQVPLPATLRGSSPHPPASRGPQISPTLFPSPRRSGRRARRRATRSRRSRAPGAPSKPTRSTRRSRSRSSRRRRPAAPRRRAPPSPPLAVASARTRSCRRRPPRRRAAARGGGRRRRSRRRARVRAAAAPRRARVSTSPSRRSGEHDAKVQLKNSVRTVRCAPPALEVRPILLRPCV